MRWLLVAVALAGCQRDPCEGISGSCLTVEVVGYGGPIDGLDLTLTGAVGFHSPGALPPGASRLPVLVGIELPPVSGIVHVAGEAFEHDREVARGATDAAISQGAHVRRTLALAAFADAGDLAASDLGTSDLAAGDLAMSDLGTSDLTTDDLAQTDDAGTDLSPSADLLPPGGPLVCVTNSSSTTVAAFAAAQDGDGAPVSAFGDVPRLANQRNGVAVDRVHDEVFVLASTVLQTFSRNASGDAAPLRTLQLPGGSLAVSYDPVNDELVVANFSAVQAFDRTASGNASPKRTIGGLSYPYGLAVDPVHDEVITANLINNSITIFSRTATGNAAPLRTISGGSTLLNQPNTVVVDTVHDEITVASANGFYASVFSRTANGNVAPLRQIGGGQYWRLAIDPAAGTLYGADQSLDRLTAFARTSGMSPPSQVIGGSVSGITFPEGLDIDPLHSELWTTTTDAVKVFAAGADGDPAPLRAITSSHIGFSSAMSAVVDATNDEIYTAGLGAMITVHARTADGNAPPLRRLFGPTTQLTANTDSLAFDPLHGELIAADIRSIYIYPRGADGDTAPSRVITSDSFQEILNLALDTVHDEIFVIDYEASAVYALPRLSNGKTAPTRTLAGAATGIKTAESIAVDTVNDELWVGDYGTNGPALAFARNANGNVAPLRQINAPSVGWLAVDPVHDELLTISNQSLVVYSRTASGSVSPLRTVQGPSGAAWWSVAADTVHDEVVIGDRGGAVTTLSRGATSSAAPLRSISESWFGMSQPAGIAADGNELFVAGGGLDAVSVFSRQTTRAPAILRSITGSASGLSGPWGVAVDDAAGALFVSNQGSSSITVYSPAATGNVAPLRTIAGAATGLSTPRGLVADAAHQELLVACDDGAIRVFAESASGNTAPLRVISGAGLGPLRGLALDGDTLFAADTSHGSVASFSRTAAGNVAPLSVISGLGAPSGIAVVGGELFVTDATNQSVAVFARDASGNAAPLRTIAGPSTALAGPIGITACP